MPVDAGADVAAAIDAATHNPGNIMRVGSRLADFASTIGRVF
jgi:hypothetical protein